MLKKRKKHKREKLLMLQNKIFFNMTQLLKLRINLFNFRQF